jgi:hypothetical protein
VQRYSALKGQYKLARRNAVGESPMNIRPVRAAQKNHQSFFIIETKNYTQGLLPLQGVPILGNVPCRDAAG